MRVRYKARALRHIEAIHSYIAKGDPGAAARVVSGLNTRSAGSLLFPCQAAPGWLREREFSLSQACPML